MAFTAPAALALGAVGAGVSAFGSIEQGQATANAANYQAQVSANNATIANQNANYATEAGRAQAQAQSMKGAVTAGRIKVAQAASGIDVNTGSAANVQVSQREQSNVDTATVMNNADLQAYGYRSQATGFEAQEGLEKEEAEQAPIGADLSAGGGLLSSASGLGLKWTQLGPTGSPAGTNPAFGTGTSGGAIY